LTSSDRPLGTLFIVATPIGNLEDITVRALRVLREVALIAAEDTRRTAHLLARHAIATRTTSLHEHNETQKSASLVERLRAGDDIALVSDAGTPTVSDPGSRLIAAAIAAGVRIEPVPGPSAVLAALAASGLPTDQFAFLGFPPTRSKDRNAWFSRLLAVGGTVVFFEAPHRIRRTLQDLADRVGNCEIAVGRELTKKHEQLVRGPIDAILADMCPERGEFTVVVDIGQMANSTRLRSDSDQSASELPRPTAATLWFEFGEMTAEPGITRRHAIGRLAKRHGMSAKDIYALIEEAKKSGVRPT
jgi:16S rRNA (cytidine1402-2'-O)-methyltransferase